jgi:hypothetical protein
MMQTNWLAGLGDDLLAGQRGAAALDQALVRVALVGAVHVQRELAGVVELEHLDAVRSLSGGALLGAGDGASMRSRIRPGRR